MIDHPEPPPEFFEVDAALRSLPLADPPAALAKNVMAAVRAGSTAPTASVRRWTWVRFGLLLLFAEALIVLALAVRYLPPGFSFYLRLQLEFWLLRLQYQTAWAPLAQGVGLLAFGLSLLALALVMWIRQMPSVKSLEVASPTKLVYTFFTFMVRREK